MACTLEFLAGNVRLVESQKSISSCVFVRLLGLHGPCESVTSHQNPILSVTPKYRPTYYQETRRWTKYLSFEAQTYGINVFHCGKEKLKYHSSIALTSVALCFSLCLYSFSIGNCSGTHVRRKSSSSSGRSLAGHRSVSA